MRTNRAVSMSSAFAEGYGTGEVQGIPYEEFHRRYLNDNNEPAYDTHSDHRNEGPTQAELVPPLLDSWGQQFCAHGCVCQMIHNKVICNKRS